VIAAKRKQIPENIQLIYMTMLFDAMLKGSLPEFLRSINIAKFVK